MLPTTSDHSDTLKTLRAMVRGTYDLQATRMQTGLRLVANFRARLRPEGQVTTAADEDFDEEAEKLIDVVKKSHKTLTEGVARNRKLPREDGFKGDEVISTYAELVLVDQFVTLLAHEESQFRQLTAVLDKLPIWTEYLQHVRGVGPAMAGILLTYLDPHRAEYASSFWYYAGLDVGPDGRGRSRRQEHLVEREYTDKNGKTAKRMGLTYNPELKTKLMGVLDSSFLRANSPWRKAYDSYKHRISTDPARKKISNEAWKKLPEDQRREYWTPGRINKASMRYMIKMFLADFWEHWRKMEGLSTPATYHEGKQGHKHYSYVPATPAAEPTPLLPKQKAKTARKNVRSPKRAAA